MEINETHRRVVALTFGSAISQGRKEKGISQKNIAAQIKREDGVAISNQYLNDIEHDRRSPSSELMVKQFANVLGLKANYLYYIIGKFPTEFVRKNASPEQVEEAFVAFMKVINNGVE